MNGRFYVGEWLVEPEQNRLVRGSETTKVDPKAIQVLSFLAQHPDEVLTKEKIIGSVWDGAFVSDEVLTTAIWGLRKALGDDAKEPRYIQTIPRRGYRLIAPVEGATAEVSRRWEPSPYPGLSAFSQRDAHYFFGREEEVEGLWGKIEKQHLLGLIGPSGAGKSSLLRAGLVPACPEGWGVILCQPRNDPFLPFEGFDAWRAEHSEALVIVDQFEELFTLNDEETQGRFAEHLAGLSKSGVHVLLSMRDDFLIRCHTQPALAPVFKDLTPVLPLEGAALRKALVEPARTSGYRFEDEALVVEILTEVSRERGAMPLLAFAASKLWEKRDREVRLLTRDAYLSIGRVEGALAKHAEETFSRIGVEHEAMVREIFRNLVSAQGTRVPTIREDLLTVFADREGAAEVLGRLIDARLLTSAGETVEVIHESLLTAWPRLVRWQAQDAEGAVLRDQLRQAARAWQERGRSEDLLWTGTSYRELALWSERYAGRLSATEQAFADAATKLAGRQRRNRRIAIGALLAVAISTSIVVTLLWRRAQAEALRAEASRLLALGELRFEEDPTEALAFATASLELADTDEARRFAVKILWEAPPAMELTASPQTVRVPAFSPDGKWLAVAGHGEDVFVWSSDGKGPLVLPGHEVSPRGPNRAEWASNELLVTGLFGNLGRHAFLWSIPEGERLRTIEFGGPSSWQAGPHRLFAETLDGGSTESEVGLLRSWTLPVGEDSILGRVDWKALGARGSFFGPEGKSWFYEKERNLFLRPLVGNLGPDRVFSRLAGNVANVSVLQASKQLIIADDSGDIHLWTFSSQGAVSERVIRKPDSASSWVLPDPAGRWLTGDPDAARQVRLWNVNAWRASRPLALRRSGSWYGSMSSFDPTGQRVVATTNDWSRLTFWPVGKTYPSVVDGYERLTRVLAFNSDGKWLATSWGDGKLRLWRLPGDEVPEVRTLVRPGTGDVKAIAFDPEDRYVFVVGNRGQAWIVPVDGSAARQLPGFSEETLLNATAVSPSGRRVAAAFWFGRGERALRVWDLETGEHRRFDLPRVEHGTGEVAGYESGISKLGFADESTLYTAGDGGLRRWNLETGSHDVIGAASPEYWMGAWFSADGRVALTTEWSLSQPRMTRALLRDLNAGTVRKLAQGTLDWTAVALDPSGTVAATGSIDGIARVGRLSGGEPHLLVGHRGAIDKIAISPDLRWIATTGEDQTLRLWPLPDLSKPPVHTLPHEELLAKLRSLTNIRVIRDRSLPDGWKIEVGPFPGWERNPGE